MAPYGRAVSRTIGTSRNIWQGEDVKLSVIVPCRNAADTISLQLDALSTQRWSEPWEVIVADNGSTDASLTIVERYKEQLLGLRVVDASGRRGAAYARNTGALAAEGDALAFCDADDEVAPGWVAAMGKALAEHDFVASRWDTSKLNALWVVRSHRNPQADGVQKYSYPPYLSHAGGSGLGVKRSLHAAIGGFDESFLQLQDTDYCWRVQLAGTPLHFAPDALVHVRYRDTVRGIYRQAGRYAEYNVLLYVKYRPLGMPHISWGLALREWARVPRYLVRIRCKADLARAAWRLGWRLGRLRGSIKHRVFAL
jgi:glycosyltransferase involved in cell wall biosynthesis